MNAKELPDAMALRRGDSRSLLFSGQSEFGHATALRRGVSRLLLFPRQTGFADGWIFDFR